MRSLLALAWLFSWGVASAQANAFEDLRAKALAGDYQAQRNLAFGYSSAPYRGQPRNPLLACAWRIVIVHSGSDRVDDSDVGNEQVYCGGLTRQQRGASVEQARALFQQAYKRAAPF